MQTHELDALTTKHTTAAFSSFADLLNAGGNYCPHFDLAFGDNERKAEVAKLAKAYDAAQAARGDSRRAHVTQ